MIVGPMLVFCYDSKNIHVSKYSFPLMAAYARRKRVCMLDLTYGAWEYIQMYETMIIIARISTAQKVIFLHFPIQSQVFFTNFPVTIFVMFSEHTFLFIMRVLERCQFRKGLSYMYIVLKYMYVFNTNVYIWFHLLSSW